MTAEEIEQFIRDQFPGAAGFSRIEALGEGTIRLRVPYRDRYLRPGGTLSGPTLMTLADTALYYLLLAKLGPLHMLTTNLNIHFLHAPAAKDMLAEGRLLRVGSRSAVGDVLMYSDGAPDPVAQATVSYAVIRSSAP